MSPTQFYIDQENKDILMGSCFSGCLSKITHALFLVISMVFYFYVKNSTFGLQLENPEFLWLLGNQQI